MMTRAALKKAEKTGRPGVAIWPGQSFRGCRGAARCSSRPASRSEDNQPAVFADSPPPHSHSPAACRALQAIRALKALQGSSALVDPELQLGCSIIMSDYSCCIITFHVMYSITLFGSLWHFLEMLSTRKKFSFSPPLPSTESHCSP